MTPPIPPRRRPSPPPRRMPAEPATPPISPDFDRFDLEAAIWIHGGYPQLSWTDAVRVLLRKCRDTSVGQICSAAIDILDRQLPVDVNLTFDRKAKIDINQIKGSIQ